MDPCEACGQPTADGLVCQPCIDRAVASLTDAELAACSGFGVWARAVELSGREPGH